MATPAEDRGPEVAVFPPVLFGLTLLAGIVLVWLVPLPLFPGHWPAWPRRVAAALVFAAGAGLLLWGERTMRAAGTEVRPDRPATALVEEGPFRYTRNPLYVGVNLFFLAAALLAKGAWFLLLLIPMDLVLHFGVVRREERYLEGKFGEPYRAYRGRVRRYV